MSEFRGLTLALAKGRLANLSSQLLARCGMDTHELLEDSRKLVFEDKVTQTRFLLVKPSDVPVYVEHGVADVGIAGKDTLLEAGLPLYEMLDLGYGRCRMCVAGYPGVRPSGLLRVATKYTRIAGMFYAARSENIEIIKLNGSIELAPILGLSDVIVDVVESGRTLVENGLEVLEEVTQISARLCVNRVSLKTKTSQITALIDQMKEKL